MTKRLDWRKNALRSKPKLSVSDELDLLEQHRTSQWLAKAEPSPRHEPEVRRALKRKASLTSVTIHTDGACSPNPGPGGWAAIIDWNGSRKELSGSELSTTNNRMELFAAIAALESLSRPCEVTVISDSQYLVKGITKWLPRWKQQAWRGVKNRGLWERLDQARRRHRVSWRWIRSHSGDRSNARAAELARAASCLTRAE